MGMLQEIYDYSKAELSKLKKKHLVLGKEMKPLAIRIRDQIQALDLGYTPEQIKNIIEVHVNTSSYHLCVLENTHRYNFDGTKSVEIEKKHKLHSIQRLKEKLKFIKDDKKKKLILETINKFYK